MLPIFHYLYLMLRLAPYFSSLNCFTRAAMSSAFHAVVRGASLTDLGNRPVLHPSHHALLLMGIKFRTWDKRRKPVDGIDVFIANAPLLDVIKTKRASLNCVVQRGSWPANETGALGPLQMFRLSTLGALCPLQIVNQHIYAVRIELYAILFKLSRCISVYSYE